MYEHQKKPLAPRRVYYKRIATSILLAGLIMFFVLWIGILGYHFIANIHWIDSLHNASMILGGMGPVVEIKNRAGKIFSSFYALFCGVIFITNIGIILAPAAHRLMHRFHLQEK